MTSPLSSSSSIPTPSRTPSHGTKRAADEETTLLRDIEDLDISAVARPRFLRAYGQDEEHMLNWMNSQLAATSPLSSSNNIPNSPPKLPPRRTLRARRVFNPADSASFARPVRVRNLSSVLAAMGNRENEPTEAMSQEDICPAMMEGLNLND